MRTEIKMKKMRQVYFVQVIGIEKIPLAGKWGKKRA